MSPRPAAGRRYLATSPFSAPPVDTTTYEVGDMVTSDRHGLGRVISCDVGAQDAPTTIVVDYRGGNLRRVTLPSSSISKIEDSTVEDPAVDDSDLDDPAGDGAAAPEATGEDAATEGGAEVSATDG